MKLSLKIILVIIILVGLGTNNQVYSNAPNKACWHNNVRYITVPATGQECSVLHNYIGSSPDLHSGESPDDCLINETSVYSQLN